MRNNRDESKARRTKAQNARPTIGYLAGLVWTRGSRALYHIWRGVTDGAREQDANLLCFVGGLLNSSFDTAESTSRRNVLYDLATSDTVDGLVIGVLGLSVSVEELQAFCDRYRPLPMVNIAAVLEDIPSVLVDNVTGLHDVVSHLIEAHGRRRIAFIRGPEGFEEAEARYRAYTEALAEHGLAFNPDLLALGDHFAPSGAAAMRMLLDERKLQPGVDFDAVVAGTDAMALGALDVLRTRGVQVPYDVALVGFDDVDEARVATPALTTVRYPLYEQGKRAVEMLLALLAGEDVPEQVVLPTEMVVRQSCGCHSQTVLQAATDLAAGYSAGETFEESLVTRREEILTAMVQALGGETASAMASEWAGQVLDGFVASMGGESPSSFLSALGRALRGMSAVSDASSTGSSDSSERNVAAWQGAISALRRQVLPWLSDDGALSRAENMWQQARLFVGEMTRQVQSYRWVQTGRQTEMLQEVGQALITTFDLEELMDVMARELPRLGIPSSYLSLYDCHPGLAEGGQAMSSRECRLILAYGEDGRVELEPEGRCFPFRELVPDGMLPSERCYSMVIESLYFRDHQLGFALFEAGPRDGAVYEVLRGQISSALQGALLLRERQQAREALEQAYAEVERKIDERSIELEREIVERERLQQEVIEAQKQALQELSTPVIPIMERIIVMPLIGSIDTLRARDITRALLAGIREHHAKVVILDITGVSVVDSDVASHLNKTIQAARLKGARTIITGISDAVAETIVDLGIDWGGIGTLSDLQTGLRAALDSMGWRIEG